MKTHIKAKALVAALMLLLFLLTSCGTTETESKEPSNNGSGSDSEESLKASALKFDWDEDLDLEQRELTISTWGAVPTRDQSEYFERRYIRSDRTEEKYNVKIKWLPVPDTTKFVQDVTLAFTAGKKYADLMFCTSFYGFDLAKLGAILPLDDYIDYSSPYYSVNGDLLKYVDGKHYSYFPDEFSPSSHGFAVIYNTMLTEAVLDPSEDPMTLYKEGKWDWDAFANVVKKTTKTNSSGEVTQWGVGGGWLLEALCMSNGFSPIGMKDKKFTCELYTDAGLNVLNFIRKLSYEYKGVDDNFQSNAMAKAFNQNKLAMAITPNWPAKWAVQNGMPVVSVPLPIGPDANGKQYIGTEFQEWWVVSSISDFTPEELLQVALDMNENDPAYPDTYQTPEIVKEKYMSRMYEGNVFVTEEEGEIFYDLLQDPNVGKIADLASYDMRWTLHSKIQLPLYTGEDPRTVLERMRPVIDTELESYLPESLK